MKHDFEEINKMGKNYLEPFKDRIVCIIAYEDIIQSTVYKKAKKEILYQVYNYAANVYFRCETIELYAFSTLLKTNNFEDLKIVKSNQSFWLKARINRVFYDNKQREYSRIVC